MKMKKNHPLQVRPIGLLFQKKKEREKRKENENQRERENK